MTFRFCDAEIIVGDEVPFIQDTRLTDTGHVPHKMQQSLRMDLGQDVVDMLKSKIYGHYGIGEYNRIRLKKSS